LEISLFFSTAWLFAIVQGSVGDLRRAPHYQGQGVRGQGSGPLPEQPRGDGARSSSWYALIRMRFAQSHLLASEPKQIGEGTPDSTEQRDRCRGNTARGSCRRTSGNAPISGKRDVEKSLKGYLRDYGSRPKKSLGQVFLIERSIQRKILELAELSQEDTVVEIGPGTGTLTRDMLPLVKSLIALEIDPDLAGFLNRSIRRSPNLHLLCADALRFDYERAAVRLGTRLKIVGNLPYAVSAPLMITFLEHRKALSLLILMVQKEVAQRLTSPTCTRQYGVLSVLCRAAFDLRLERHVSRNCFYPIPRVDSALVRFVAKESAAFPDRLEPLFREVVRAAFSKRRKTLFNALRSSPLGVCGEESLRTILANSGIGPDRRPETLSPEEYACLTLHMHDTMSLA
jgi:16S rRNA (adenine1518-N6/adenine1519-N6)-dimethyltransferase